MKVMIIGGAGFVGSATAIYLIQHTNFSIVSIDNLSSTNDIYNLEQARRATSRHEFYIADARDDVIMAKILRVESPDVVIFAIDLDDSGIAAVKAIDRARRSESLHFQKTIVICSHPGQSGSYGKLEDLPDFSGLPNHIIVSTCRIFGPRQHSRHFVPSVIYGIMGLAKAAEPNKTEPQEWLYVLDFFKALLAIVVAPKNLGHYCVSSGQVATELEIAKNLEQIMEGGSQTEDASVVVSNTIDTSEINELGWKPLQDLNKALEHTARWYSDNKWARR